MTARQRRSAVEALRQTLVERFGDLVDPAPRPVDGRALASGWTVVDRALPGGGLDVGETAIIEGEPGAGTLALAATWARAAARRGEPVVVFDSAGNTHPHAWVEPEGAGAPIWRFAAGEAEVWPALDVAARSRAFGLLVLLEPPPGPVGAAPRILRHAREGSLRMLVTQWPGRAAPWAPTHRIRLDAGTVRWVVGPTGDAPTERTLEVSLGSRDAPRPVGTQTRDDVLAPRVPAPAGAPDRRAPSGRRGRTRRSGAG